MRDLEEEERYFEFINYMESPKANRHLNEEVIGSKTTTGQIISCPNILPRKK